MNRRFLTFGIMTVLSVGVAARVHAADAPAVDPASAAPAAAPAPAPVPADVDDAMRKKIEQKAGRIADALKLEDPAKAAKVKAIAADWQGVMLNWHQSHDAELGRLWGEWNKARAIVPKDEFPAEVIANQIDDVYASLKPAYDAYVKRLSAELSAEQVDAIKENWSRSPGMTRTYNAYLEIVPDLAAKDKEVIKARMLMNTLKDPFENLIGKTFLRNIFCTCDIVGYLDGNLLRCQHIVNISSCNSAIGHTVELCR